MSDQEARRKRLSARLNPSAPIHKDDPTRTSSDTPSTVDRTPQTVHGTTDQTKSWEERNVRATYWVPAEVRDAVKAAADREGISLAQWVSRALRRALTEGEMQ